MGNISCIFANRFNCVIAQGLEVADYRGLLTDREREILSGQADVSRNYELQIRYRVRDKIERLIADIEILQKHHPDLASELREAVEEAYAPDEYA